MSGGVEWDERKRLTNLDEHGVDFQDAALIFLGPVLEAEGGRKDCGERRFRALGQVEDDVFLVPTPGGERTGASSVLGG